MKRDSKILVARRYNTTYGNGQYSQPAGHVEEGETFVEAFIREAKVEINIDIDPKDAHIAHMMHQDSQRGSDALRYRLEIFFIVEKWIGGIENMEPDKCDNLSWSTLDELPDNTIPYIKEALENIENGTPYSEYGYK